MIITNRKGLSRAWVLAAQRDTYKLIGDYSATGLIAPVQVQMLLRRHWDDIKVDVIDLMWILLGRSVHFILEQAKTQNVLTEQTMMLNILGRQISMTPDRVAPIEHDHPGIQSYQKALMPLDIVHNMFPQKEWNCDSTQYHLRDFKITSVYAVKNGVKSDWLKQVNIYAYAMRQYGFLVTKASVEALLKDWSYTDAVIRKVHNYPDAQVQRLPVQLWPDARCQRYLEDRVQLFTAAEKLPDEKLPRCSAEERWAQPDRFAVIQLDGKGKGSAVRGGASFSSREAAEQFKATYNGKFKTGIQFRKGTSTRCERYCDVRPFCHQYRNEISDDEF